MKPAVLFFCLFFPGLSLMASDAQKYPDTLEDSSVTDYCYKPQKPLWLTTAIHKKQYKEDMQEYERCKKHFYQVHQNIAKMKSESEQRSKVIQKEFEEHNK